MGPCPNLLLVLVLCLAPAVHLGDGAPPAPSIGAEPGPVIRRGQPVTIVCRGPAGADVFRLVEKENVPAYWDQKISSPHGSQETEARFRIPAASEVMARSFFCSYHKGSSWSKFSDLLKLEVTLEDVSALPSAPASWNYTMENCVRIGLAGAVLLILVAILAEAGHSRRRWPHRP